MTFIFVKEYVKYKKSLEIFRSNPFNILFVKLLKSLKTAFDKTFKCFSDNSYKMVISHSRHFEKIFVLLLITLYLRSKKRIA